MRKTSRLFKFALLLLMIFSVVQSRASTPIDITINRDGVLLQGKFYISEGIGPFPTVMLLNGFPGSESDVLGIGNLLSDSGLNALTFNYCGTFQSQSFTSSKISKKIFRQHLTFFINQRILINIK